MARFEPARSAGRLVHALTSGAWKARIHDGMQTLKSEYEAGTRGEESPVTPVWPTPAQQLERMLALLKRTPKAEPGTDPEAASVDADADADEVSAALKGVDWAGVRAATAQRTSDAARAMRTMAQQVDWTKVQPVAAHVSSALIAAVAAGHIPVGGRLGPLVARAIVDQGGLAERVGEELSTEPTPLPDFRGAIETTARDAGA
jgi:hypothetical protein